MFKKQFFLIGLLTASLFSANVAMSDADINKSQSIAGGMKKGLGGLLKQKLEKEGPVAAFGFCSDVAMGSTSKIAYENNASIKRVSSKLRNQQNKPDELDLKALKEYEAFKNELQAPKYLVLKDPKSGATKFYEPMYVMGMCLACHGEPSKMQDGVKTQISQKYPADQAVGYQIGDFRGLIAIELKK